ncbi:MAG: hypothetical protein K2H97_04200 [Prevotella sp.]|nr:hypothetical protein [Prevotella sp.]
MSRTKRVINAFPYMVSPQHLSAAADEYFPPSERRAQREDGANLGTIFETAKGFDEKMKSNMQKYNILLLNKSNLTPCTLCTQILHFSPP